ncbi:MAG: hypothetical protein E7254_11455 [Lachnospiraceae bacterium]|nr:hypothetical protein [Lachnospiraceae bacterium]
MLKKWTQTTYAYVTIVVTLCLGILSYFMSMGLNGNDFWWHIKAGNWILSNHAFPKYDMFSWYAQEIGLKWTAHEWLSEVIFAVVYNIGGQYGIFLFSFIAAAILLILLVSVCKEYTVNNIIYTVIFLIFTTMLFKIYCFGRPHLFSFFLLFFELKCLYDFIENRSEKSIYFIPLIALLWANFHGGSSNLSYVLCIFVIITGAFNFRLGKVVFTKLENAKLIKLAGAAITSMIAICINPYGTHMLAYPYENMADKIMLKLIAEWAAPDAKEIAILIFFFMPFAFGLLTLIATEKDINATDLIIFAFFSYMFFRSGRFIVFLMISLPFYTFRYAPKMVTLNNPESKADKLVSSGLIGLFSIIILMGLFNGYTSNKNGILVKRELDTKFIDLIKSEAPSRPFTDYNYGGELIFSDVQVYVDGRADVYTGEPIRDYCSLYSLLNHDVNDTSKDKAHFLTKLLDKYQFDAFLIDKERALTTYLYENSDKYELVEQDENTAYFRVVK